ncbi:nose resistant to fluoxetine protein 6-like [Tropilaelaps mercedesae]|uniref:Nose resistant to fluoxetine protein 6-like n=1 Tax=Tropilaelaps mercedesae TaxID=418985 RepID=A0A1V9XSK9_9ACAR|nr:nose resistant to fluoxetine protein 6-like [Tropilaelaps mercedesae]
MICITAVIRWILNRPNYIILSRLSYSFYLSQYIVMILKNFTARYTIAFTYYQNFRDFFADMIFNYLLAFLVFLLFEAPGSELEKLVFDKPSVKLLAKANQADGISNGHHVKDILTDAVLITADGKTTNLSDLAVSEPKLESHLSATYKL